MEEKAFQEWLDSIDAPNKCPFRVLPRLTVGQAKRLYSKYLILITDNDFLIEETKRRLNRIKYYPDHWDEMEAVWVEGLVCNQDKL